MTALPLPRRTADTLAGALALFLLGTAPALAQRVTETASLAAIATRPAATPGAPTVPTVVMTRETSGKATVQAVRVSGDFVLDGLLNEAIYATVAPLGDFVQQEPSEG
ncbi:MAG: hypothetical protein ABW067_02170, partial [Rhizobacter sp.]